MEEKELILNNPDALQRADSLDMFGALYNLPEQCLKAWQMGMQCALPERRDYRNVVVTGLGGSAIGGDLLRVYAGDRMEIPVAVNRDYLLPLYVNRHTLLFAVSYSGNTEETLSAYDEARDRGAAVVAVTTGGKLGERAARDGVPQITVPPGIMPRSATGYLFLPMLAVLSRLGLLEDPAGEVEELASVLRGQREKLHPGVPAADNPAKQLALKLYNRIPVIWGASATSEVAAQRWKGQVNENAKAPAYWNVFPELNHNEVVGFEAPAELLRKLHIVILRDVQDHPRVKIRMDITRDIVEKAAGGVSEVEAVGDGTLARMYSLVYLGDYASVYLAVLYGIDPGPVKVIDHLKAELARR